MAALPEAQARRGRNGGGEARVSTTDAEARKAEYAKAAELYLADRQRIYMYHQNWFWAMTAALEGFKPHPDGMIRLEGVSLKK